VVHAPLLPTASTFQALLVVMLPTPTAYACLALSW
jgi:hypothetical protein